MATSEPSMLDVIGRARRAQQEHVQRHDVQLEMVGWDTLTERGRGVTSKDGEVGTRERVPRSVSVSIWHPGTGAER